MGGGKGGSDFDPKGKSDDEVMRFCQSFMAELSRHIGPNTDIPAGDIGVGAREIGYLFGHVQKTAQRIYRGAHRQEPGLGRQPDPTRSHRLWGGVFCRRNAGHPERNLEGKICLVSGSGNVAQYTAEKIIELGGKVVTMSDSSGYIYDEEGIDRDKLDLRDAI